MANKTLLIMSLADYIKDKIDDDHYFDISKYTPQMLGVTKATLAYAVKMVVDNNNYEIITLRKQITSTNFRYIKLIVKSDFKYEDIYNKFIKED